MVGPLGNLVYLFFYSFGNYFNFALEILRSNNFYFYTLCVKNHAAFSDCCFNFLLFFSDGKNDFLLQIVGEISHSNYGGIPRINGVILKGYLGLGGP